MTQSDCIVIGAGSAALRHSIIRINESALTARSGEVQ